MFTTKNAKTAKTAKTSKIGISPKKSIFENFVIIRQELEKQIASNLSKLNYIEKLRTYIDQLKNKNHKQSEEIRVTRQMLNDNDYEWIKTEIKNLVKRLELVDNDNSLQDLIFFNNPDSYLS